MTAEDAENLLELLEHRLDASRATRRAGVRHSGLNMCVASPGPDGCGYRYWADEGDEMSRAEAIKFLEVE